MDLLLTYTKMKELSNQELLQYNGSNMEIVIVYEKINAYCGIQRIYAEGVLYSMRYICD